MFKLLGRHSFKIFSSSALLVAVAIGLTGCGDSAFTNGGSLVPQIGLDDDVNQPAKMYAEEQDSGYDIPAIPYQQVPAQFRRQIVSNTTGEEPGTIVVDTNQHFLYYTLPDGDAIRYGVGVGRAGFEWSGRANVQYKKEWPRWTPPSEMIARQPELEKYKSGMEPGLNNPLGARALYIYQKDSNGKSQDTGYRIHGSPEWQTIGKSMSSGCIRLLNQDIIDLYNRASSGTPIVVR